MNRKRSASLDDTARIVGLALVVALLLMPGVASAQRTQYLGDGAAQSSTGGWDFPYSSLGAGTGSCPADTNQTTRTECLALRLTSYTTSAACTAVTASVYGVTQAIQSWSTGVCNDTETTQDRKSVV